jgi:hypothetical protein
MRSAGWAGLVVGGSSDGLGGIPEQETRRRRISSYNYNNRGGGGGGGCALDRVADDLELKPGCFEQALELEGAALIEPLVVVIETDKAGEAAQDLLRRPDGPHYMMTARLEGIEGTLQ